MKDFKTDLVCTSEASVIIGCGPENVRFLARTGKLPVAVQTKAGQLFQRTECERLAAERRRRRLKKASQAKPRTK